MDLKMQKTRIFKNKWFFRFARKESIEDADLCAAISYVEEGLIDVDLGGGVVKQRIARAKEGKSGGYRSIILFRSGDKAFFVYGFAKSKRDNINHEELEGFKALADEMLGYDEATLTRSLKSGAIVEVKCDEKTVSK